MGVDCICVNIYACVSICVDHDYQSTSCSIQYFDTHTTRFPYDTFYGTKISPITHTQDTFDALSAALHTLSSSGIHPLLIKAIIKAQLLTMDAHLLNALVLRREACDIAGAEALRGLLEALRGWAAQEGALWRGDVGDVDRCMERCQQAVVFLLRGKDVLAAHAQEVRC